MKRLELGYWTSAFGALKTAFAAAEQQLCGYDAAIGDGDHGTSMALGFAEAERALAEHEPTDIGELFQTAGVAFMGNVGGVTGVVFGTLFLSLSEATAGVGALTVRELRNALADAVDAVKVRGKVREGQKSLVDALAPAVRALERAEESGPREALKAAASAAREGMEATRSMEAGVGRARYQGANAIGHVDPGAASVALMFEILAEAKASTPS
jgi:dihydroxyacetone kinase-like protein